MKFSIKDFPGEILNGTFHFWAVKYYLQEKVEEFFVKDLELFSRTQKPLIWASYFFHKKIIYTIFQVRLFHFNIIFITSDVTVSIVNRPRNGMRVSATSN